MSCPCREAFGNAAEVEYRWVREYNYEVKQENNLQQEYVLRFQPSGVFYTVLGPKLTLRKRSKHKGAMQDITRPSKVQNGHSWQQPVQVIIRQSKTQNALTTLLSRIFSISYSVHGI